MASSGVSVTLVDPTELDEMSASAGKTCPESDGQTKARDDRDALQKFVLGYDVVIAFHALR